MNGCKECRDGEHEDYDFEIKLCTVRDPDGLNPTRRMKLCSEHRSVFEMDGYEVKEVR